MKQICLAALIALSFAAPSNSQQRKECTAIIDGGSYAGCHVEVFNSGATTPVVMTEFPWVAGNFPDSPGELNEGQCGLCQASVQEALRRRFRGSEFPFFGNCRDPSGVPGYCILLLGDCFVTSSCGVEPFDCDRPTDEHFVFRSGGPTRVRLVGNALIAPPTFLYLAPEFEADLAPGAFLARRHETSFDLVAFHEEVSFADCNLFPAKEGRRLGLSCRAAQGLFAARMPRADGGKEDRLSGSIAFSGEPVELYAMVAENMAIELSALLGVRTGLVETDDSVPLPVNDSSVQLVAWTDTLGVGWVAMPELQNAAGSFYGSRYLAFLARVPDEEPTGRSDGKGGTWSTYLAPARLQELGVLIEVSF